MELYYDLKHKDKVQSTSFHRTSANEANYRPNIRTIEPKFIVRMLL